MAKDKKSIVEIYVNIVFRAKFSWLTALKLRLAGGEYVKHCIEQQINNQKEINDNDS